MLKTSTYCSSNMLQVFPPFELYILILSLTYKIISLTYKIEKYIYGQVYQFYPSRFLIFDIVSAGPIVFWGKKKGYQISVKL